MRYEVIEDFTDLQDRERVYRKGDTFPIEGVEVSDERLEALLSSNNKRKEPVIKEVEETEVVEEVEEVIEEVEEEVSLEDKTIPELKELADEEGLEYNHKIKKADLIELLEK